MTRPPPGPVNTSVSSRRAARIEELTETVDAQGGRRRVVDGRRQSPHRDVGQLPNPQLDVLLAGSLRAEHEGGA